MKAYIIILQLCIISLGTHAQENKVADGASDSSNTNVVQLPGVIDQLALQIQKNYRTSKDRLLAIHIWVARNIVYDTDSMYIINWKLSEEEAIEEAMRRRRGVCQNYSTIFNALARRCGIETFVVDGFTKQHGRADKTGHTWVAVKLNEDWAFCDPTWDKDDPNAQRHFLISPDVFIQTHLPFDPLWQLLPYEVTVADFINGNIGKKINKPTINYKDSVYAYGLLSPLQRLEAAHARMQKNAGTSQLYRNQVAYVNMKISIFYEEEDLQLYNESVKHFNEATQLLNQFLQYRNNGFSPAKSFTVLSADLDAVSKKINLTYNNIRKIGSKMPNEACNPSLLMERTASLDKRLVQEKLFLQNYFAQNKALQKP